MLIEISGMIFFSPFRTVKLNKDARDIIMKEGWGEGE